MSNMNQSQKRKKIFLRKYSKPARKEKPKQFSKSEILKKIAEDTETETETESEEPEEQSLNQIFGLGLVEFFVFFIILGHRKVQIDHQMVHCTF